MTDFWVFSLIPVNIIAIILFFSLFVSFLYDRKSDTERAWTIFFGLLVAFIISVTTICLNSSQADNSPARPMAALGLISSSLVIFLGASAFLWLEKFISSRKELSEEVNRKVEKLIKKRLMENEEILKREGL